MKSTKPTVTDTAAVLIAAAGSAGHPQSLLLRVPTGGNTVYLGGSDVSSANGFPIAAGESYVADIVNDALWAVCATGQSQAVNILRRHS